VAGCANGRRRVGTLGLALAAALLGARAAPAQTAVPANLAPVLSFEPDPAGGHWIPWTTLVERRWLNLGLRVSDPDGDAVTVAASPLPPGAVLRDPGPRDPLYPFRHARYFDWTPAAGQAGTYPVTFTASDGRASTSQTVVFTVRSTVGPRPPVTWIYDPATRRWTEVVTARRPAEREAALIAYDPVRARTFLYGGRLGGIFSYAVSRDLWEWDGATWTEVPLPGLAPAGRGALAYDGAQKRLVLCDGEDLFEHRPDMPWLAAPDWRGALGAGPIDLRSRVDVDVTVELTESFVNVHGRLAGQVSDWSERWSLLLRLTGTGPDDLSLSIEGVPAEYAGGVPGRATIGADGTFVFGAGNGGRSPSAIVDARQRAISGRILPGREVRIESIATSRFFWHAASPAVSRIQVVRLAAEAAGFLHP